MKKRGKVTISLDKVAALLHLHEGLTVTDVRVNRNTETVVFYLEGDGLEESPRRSDARNYPLTGLMEWDLR